MHYDLIIVGGGPAGLTAGIYGARAKLKTLIIEKSRIGGQVYTTREIVNYPGFLKGTTGPKLIEAMVKHNKDFGTEFIKDEVFDLNITDKVIITKSGKKLNYNAIILATGSHPRKLNIKGEKKFTGQGVSYCATCDAEFYEDLNVVVVGNGDAAIEEAIFIAKFAKKVTIIVIHDEGILDCNKYSAEKAFINPKIEFVWNSTLLEIKGDYEVESVVIKNIKTGELYERKTDGVFIYVGTTPNTSFLEGKIDLDDDGYIMVNEKMETSAEGVFAAGDSRVKYLRQVITAANDGAIAAVAVERYIFEEKSFVDQVVNAKTPVVLAFWSPFNEKSIEVILKLEQSLSEELNCNFKLVKIDVYKNTTIPKKFSVDTVPKVLLLEDGKVINDIKTKRDYELRDISKLLRRDPLNGGKDN